MGGGSDIELKAIKIRDGCANEHKKKEEDGLMNIDASGDLRKILTYKLSNDGLMEDVVQKMHENPDLLFCGFKVECEHDVQFNNNIFNYEKELEYLKDSFGKYNGEYLINSIEDRFWFIKALNKDYRNDEIKIYVPSKEGFVLPKISVKFIKYEKWVTGCFFKTNHYRIFVEE